MSVLVCGCRCCRGLGYVDDKSLERLSVLFPRLGSVELRLCSTTDDGLVKFCHHNQLDGGLRRLVLDRPGDITDRALMMLADHSPSLLHLTLAHCPSVTNSALRSVCTALSSSSSSIYLSTSTILTKKSNTTQLENILAKWPTQGLKNRLRVASRI